MRMSGQVMGARATTATRRSVIFKSEGLELVLVFCGRASRVWSAQKPAPSAPTPFKNERRAEDFAKSAFMSGMLSPFGVPGPAIRGRTDDRFLSSVNLRDTALH